MSSESHTPTTTEMRLATLERNYELLARTHDQNTQAFHESIFFLEVRSNIQNRATRGLLARDFVNNVHSFERDPSGQVDGYLQTLEGELWVMHGLIEFMQAYKAWRLENTPFKELDANERALKLAAGEVSDEDLRPEPIYFGD